MHIHVVRNYIIDYYNENDTDCYLLLLDASKAFDRVEYVKLFNTLRHRKTGIYSLALDCV